LQVSKANAKLIIKIFLFGIIFLKTFFLCPEEEGQERLVVKKEG